MSHDSKGMHISRIWGSRPVGDEQLTIDATAGGISLTPAKYAGAKGALITVETADIRFRITGEAPTTTIGHLAEDGDEIEIGTFESIETFRAIRTGSTSAVINVTYFE